VHAGQPAAACSLVGAAINSLEPGVGTGSAEYLSVWGALLLASAIAAARQGDRATCRLMLREAGDAAGRVGHADELHMTFGPTNVRIHAVSTATELGDMERTCALLGESIALAQVTGDQRGLTLAERLRRRLPGRWQSDPHVRRPDDAIGVARAG
jgi:hypothetical protein